MRKLTERSWHSSDSNSGGLEPTAMESPLDVLSRAASLVETSSRHGGKLFVSLTATHNFLCFVFVILITDSRACDVVNVGC